MIDEKNFMNFMTALEDAGAEYVCFDDLRRFIDGQPKVGEWVPCSERFPENEYVVEITYTRKQYLTGKTLYLTARAFHTDGKTATEKSDYTWDDIFDFEYDEEKDDYLIPEGWWEDVSFGEELFFVDGEVIAWRPLPEPYREEENNAYTGNTEGD